MRQTDLADNTPPPPAGLAIGIALIGVAIIALAWFGPEAQFNAPRYVVALVGVVFLQAGIVSGLSRGRGVRPSLYLFCVAVFFTTFASIPAWIWMFATGGFTLGSTTGGATVATGSVGNIVGRTAFGLAFLVMLPFVYLAWRRWYRAWRNRNYDAHGRP
ncbi:MAG: hypothetical protein ABIO63_00485 [Casimicrobiaceae bacterium]